MDQNNPENPSNATTAPVLSEKAQSNTAETSIIPPDELNEKIKGFSVNYFLVDVRRDRKSYYAMVPELFSNPPVYQYSEYCTDFEKYFFCISGIALNLVMDGELEKAGAFIDSLPNEGIFQFMRLGLTLVHPHVRWKEFMGIIEVLKKNGVHLANVVITAGRPSMLNGVNDFTRIGPFLEKRKDLFIENLSYICDKNLCPAIYNICLAEYLYQQNNLMQAEVLVSHVIKEFDSDLQRRLLFAASFLQTKILLAQGEVTHPEAYITDIRKSVKERGRAEFSSNIDAAEILSLMYEGNTKAVQDWLADGAPDEYSDFCMLDLWRYMVKIRAYIIVKNYAAVLALVEKLRPLLEEGKRYMDLCELDLLNAIALFRADKKEIAYKALKRSLKIARRRKFFRVISDEGEAVLPLITSFMNEKEADAFESSFFETIIDAARSLAVHYPLYLKPVRNETVLSDTEIEILRFLERGKTVDEIASYFVISKNTVKYHLKNMYHKLGVQNATGAVWKSRLRGIL